MSKASATSHWAVAAAGVVLIAAAVVVGVRDGFALDAVVQGTGREGKSDVVVASLAALGAVAVFVWMRARAAERLAGRGRDD